MEMYWDVCATGWQIFQYNPIIIISAIISTIISATGETFYTASAIISTIISATIIPEVGPPNCGAATIIPMRLTTTITKKLSSPPCGVGGAPSVSGKSGKVT